MSLRPQAIEPIPELTTLSLTPFIYLPCFLPIQDIRQCQHKQHEYESYTASSN